MTQNPPFTKIFEGVATREQMFELPGGSNQGHAGPYETVVSVLWDQDS